MNRIVKRSLLIAVMLGFVGKVSSDEKDAKPRYKIEIRRAETKPADGLVEATVEGTETKVYLHPMAEATERDIAEAVSRDDANGHPAVAITFTKEGAKKMAKVSEQHIDKPLAIMVDGKVINAPVIRSPLSDRVMLTGRFSKAEVEKLVKDISSKVSSK